MYNSLPMYHRIGKAAYKADIKNTEALMERLGHPEKQLRCIHVAGTNGKGSVSHMLASIMQQAGYKVGLYTSPHLVDFRERIRVNGVMIPRRKVSRFIEREQEFLKAQGLSFFEMTVGLAFGYFVEEQVDVAVVEVGMGGRLDSTNVIMPDVSVITNIGLDHTQFLGDTLAKIAREKAGIIKRGVPVVVGETHAETKPVFDAVAAGNDAPIMYADSRYRIVDTCGKTAMEPADSAVLHFDVEQDGGVVMRGCVSPLSGAYQLKNIATMMQTVDVLRGQGHYRISERDVREGIANVVHATGLHGRWQLLRTNPTVICETAHNADGVGEMLGKLRQLRYDRLHLIYGCVNDKDFRTILHLLPHNGKDASHEVVYYYTRPSVPRGLDEKVLAAAADEIGMKGRSYADAKSALKTAIAAAKQHDGCRCDDAPCDLVLLTGSIFLVADALAAHGAILNC